MRYLDFRPLCVLVSLSSILWGCSRNTASLQDSADKRPQIEVRAAFQPDVDVIKTGVSGMPEIRFVTGYLDGRYFDSANLEALFKQLAVEYNQQQFLNFDVYSDHEMLRRQSSYLASPPPGDPAVYSTAYQRWAKKNLPTKGGYYWAHYTRNDTEEYFDYTPDASGGATVRVDLRGQK
jgi:hypothetical protein